MVAMALLDAETGPVKGGVNRVPIERSTLELAALVGHPGHTYQGDPAPGTAGRPGAALFSSACRYVSGAASRLPWTLDLCQLMALHAGWERLASRH
jgi:hypothetical protein